MIVCLPCMFCSEKKAKEAEIKMRDNARQARTEYRESLRRSMNLMQAVDAFAGTPLAEGSKPPVAPKYGSHFHKVNNILELSVRLLLGVWQFVHGLWQFVHVYDNLYMGLCNLTGCVTVCAWCVPVCTWCVVVCTWCVTVCTWDRFVALPDVRQLVCGVTVKLKPREFLALTGDTGRWPACKQGPRRPPDLPNQKTIGWLSTGLSQKRERESECRILVQAALCHGFMVGWSVEGTSLLCVSSCSFWFTSNLVESFFQCRMTTMVWCENGLILQKVTGSILGRAGQIINCIELIIFNWRRTKSWIHKRYMQLEL